MKPVVPVTTQFGGCCLVKLILIIEKLLGFRHRSPGKAVGYFYIQFHRCFGVREITACIFQVHLPTSGKRPSQFGDEGTDLFFRMEGKSEVDKQVGFEDTMILGVKLVNETVVGLLGFKHFPGGLQDQPLLFAEIQVEGRR